MNKNIFLLNTFLLVNIQADTPPFNPKTYGLSEETCTRLQKELGIGWGYVIQYLSKDPQEIAIDVNKHHYKVKGFHSWNVTKHNAPDIAQMRACETCPELGALVNENDYLRETLSKISKAQDTLVMKRAQEAIEKEKACIESAERTIRAARLNTATLERQIKDVQAHQAEQDLDSFSSELKAFAQKTLLPLLEDNKEFFERFADHMGNSHHNFPQE